MLLLLSGGCVALDRVLTTAITSKFDNGIEYMLNSLIVSAEIRPDGEVIFNLELADQRTLEPYSGLYWQVSARGQEDFPSRSLLERRLTLSTDHHDVELHAYPSARLDGRCVGQEWGTTVRYWRSPN